MSAKAISNRLCQLVTIIILTLVFLIIAPVIFGNMHKVYADNGNVTINATNFPDENFRSYVKDNFDSDKNGILSAEEIAGVSSIKIDNSNIYDLTGLEYFANLTQLIYNNNQLTNLDISNNRSLEILNCTSNHLTSLDLSNNDNLSLDSLRGDELDSSSSFFFRYDGHAVSLW